MATILFNTTQTLPIPYFSDHNSSIHNPNGVDTFFLKLKEYMITLASSYNSVKSSWNWIPNLISDETNLIENLTILTSLLFSVYYNYTLDYGFIEIILF